MSCSCGCSHAYDAGPCPTFVKGKNGRCVYCDHAEKCHERYKPGDSYNTPFGASNQILSAKEREWIRKHTKMPGVSV